MDTAFSNFCNAKRLCLFCFMSQEHRWHYSAFNQLCLAKGKIAAVVLLSNEAKQNKIHNFTWADQEWIGLMTFKNFVEQDWIGFSFVGSGLDSD